MLDLFFRKYAWTANLALLLMAAWLSAKTVNTLVGAAIRPRPQADLVTAPSEAPRAPAATTLDTDKLYRLIGIEPPRAAEASEPARASRPQTCNDAGAAPVRSELRLQLVAGIIAAVPRQSLATISDPSTRETRVLGVGDDIGGAQLLAVERARDDRDATGNGFKVVAVVCNGGTKEYLDYESAGGAAASSETPGPMNVGVAPVPAPRPGPGGAMEGIRKLADNRYEIDRAVLDRTMGDLNTVATQARIVPSFKNGVANGFKLFSIQPGSLYSSIGVENGDVIQRINGYEINSPDKALEIYQKLRESSHVTLDLDRGGQVIHKEYQITP